MILALSVFFIQETGLTYQVNYESLIECSTEKTESREARLNQNLVKSETKKLALKSSNESVKKDPHSHMPSQKATLPINRTILYRSLLI
jgi:hypothetical protein